MMGIFTALVLLVPLAVLTGVWEGAKAIAKRHKENRAWKRERAVHYPKMRYDAYTW